MIKLQHPFPSLPQLFPQEAVDKSLIYVPPKIIYSVLYDTRLGQYYIIRRCLGSFIFFSSDDHKAFCCI